jgi:hypothetical protein
VDLGRHNTNHDVFAPGVPVNIQKVGASRESGANAGHNKATNSLMVMSA